MVVCSFTLGFAVACGTSSGGAAAGAGATGDAGASSTAGNGGSAQSASAGSAGELGASAGSGGSVSSAAGTSAAIGGDASSSGGASTGAGGAGNDGGASGAVGSAGSVGNGGASSSVSTIVNDRFWKDTSGTFIYSQGGGVLQVAGTYYWYGVKYGGAPTYAASPTKKNSDTSFAGITTYSSKDLVNWKLEATDQPANTSGWFGRLGVAYNATSKKYVLVAQGGGGLYFATSDKPNGGFVYDHVQTNLPGIVNGATGDQTIFQDDDGQAYLVSSSSDGRANRYVSPLRAADFLAAENAVLVYKGGGREGNCMFKYSGHYYFCSSDLHGWNASQTYCVSAANINGPYGAEFVLSGTEPDYSHVTQTGFFFNVVGSAATTVIFAGDRWSDFAGNGLGFNQWLPLSFSGTTPQFHSLSAWSIDLSAGTWSAASTNNWILNPTFEADRVAVTTPVGWTATNGSNDSDHRTGNWSFQLTAMGTLTQSIPSLPNGSYTLSVWSKSTVAGAMLSANNFGASDKSIALPSGTSWTQTSLSGLTVSNGKLDVAVSAGSATIELDDFSLVSSN